MFPLFIAHVLFWALLLIGASDIGGRNAGIYIGLWMIGYVATGWVPSGGLVFLSYVAVLDVALVFHVFGGDVRL